jgi:hypothetical protein
VNFREIRRYVTGLQYLVKAVVRDLIRGRANWGSCDGYDDGVARFGVAWYPAEGCWLCPRMILTTPYHRIFKNS